MLAASIDAIGRIDDSLNELGRRFRDNEPAYLALLSRHLDRPGLLLDLVELVVWENYGLRHEVEPFLRRLTETPRRPRATRSHSVEI